jgi:hypothetical protein
MKQRILILLMTFAIVFTIITPGLAPRAEAAGGTVKRTYIMTASSSHSVHGGKGLCRE